MVRFTILLIYSSDLGLAFQVKHYGALKLYTACSTASAGKLSIGITAAGFPANRRLVKASIWNIGVRISSSVI
jgi:hypothetical protein